MRLWLIKEGEPIPGLARGNRLLRMGMLAEALSKAGHEVHWFSSNFDHFTKKFHSENSSSFQVNPNLHVNLVKANGYRKNISIERIRHNRQLGKDFQETFKRFAQKPDLIFCAVPPTEIAKTAADFAKKNNIPIVADLRDMWPDIFVDILPSSLKPFSRAAVYPLKKELRNTLRNCNAITSITDEFLDWGLKSSGRSKALTDRVFHHAYHPPKSIQSDWKPQGVDYESDFLISYVGAISSKLDLEPLKYVSEKLRSTNPKVKFIFAGTGDRLKQEKKRFENCENVIFPGWLNHEQMYSLLTHSQLGLSPFQSRRDFEISIPNKAVEYMAHGLPILSSLRGTLCRFIQENNCGIFYSNDEPELLARKIHSLAMNPSILNELKLNSEKAFTANFTARKVFGEMESFFQEITETRWPKEPSISH